MGGRPPACCERSGQGHELWTHGAAAGARREIAEHRRLVAGDGVPAWRFRRHTAPVHGGQHERGAAGESETANGAGGGDASRDEAWPSVGGASLPGAPGYACDRWLDEPSAWTWLRRPRIRRRRRPPPRPPWANPQPSCRRRRRPPGLRPSRAEEARRPRRRRLRQAMRPRASDCSIAGRRSKAGSHGLVQARAFAVNRVQGA
mmetsp:Transcript_81651/g.235910  ORF Transcript_81651/g.235910 Transcript_81651/m.235910 type:complete len:203 (+) Transcript_81651:1017-1625(+)